MVASAHNFADDNTFSSFAKTMGNLISILDSESEITINWFKYNHTIVNPVNFKQQSPIKAKEIMLTKL